MRRLFDLETARGLFTFGAALGLCLFPLLWSAHLGIAALRQHARAGDHAAPAGDRPTSASVPEATPRAATSDPPPALLVPVQGVPASTIPGSFGEDRGGRRHAGLDIRAERGTPVLAAADGRILSLLTSSRGGTEIYQLDASGRYCLYYAHLQRYALGVHEDMSLVSGALIAYVGSTGNAPEDAPHLHLAVFRTDGRAPVAGRCSGEALDPLPLLR